MRTFDTLDNRYTITFDLVSEDSLHVGTGLESERSDAAIAYRNGKPYIPGSTLRGVLRSTVERMMVSIWGPGTRSCVLFADDASLEPAATVCMAGNREAHKRIERGEDVAAKNPGLLMLCPVCRLFGSTLMAGRMKISDAVQVEGQVKREVKVRDGVGIDRDTGSAKEAIKFNFDVLDPEVQFRFTMTIENAETEELALLHLMVMELERGLHFGGMKNRGMGLVKCTGMAATRLEKAGLRAYFASGIVPALPAAELKGLALAAFAGMR